MKNHINVCTDHCCANFFHSHVKTFVFFHEKTSLNVNLGWPKYPKVANTPGRTLTPAKELDTGRRHSSRKAEANCFCCLLLLVVATAALKGSEVSVEVISSDFGWTCAVSPTAKPWLVCLLPPWASSGERRSSSKRYNLVISNHNFFFLTQLWQRKVGWGWNMGCIFCIQMTLEVAGSCKVSWVTHR